MSIGSCEILQVASDFPYPPTHGGRVDIWGRLQALKALGHSVHLVATVKREPSSEAVRRVAEVASRVTVVKRRSNLAGVVGRRPVQVATRTALKSVKLRSSYDVAILESEYVSPILENPCLHCHRRVLRVHNDEQDFFRQSAASERNPLARLYYSLEAGRFVRWSSRIMSEMNQLWFISRDFHQKWASELTRQTGVWLPPAAAPQQRQRSGARSGQVMFAGNLTAPTNLEGLHWYLNRVHPVLRERIADYEFLITGSAPETSVPEFLRRAVSSDPRCRLLLNAPHLGPHYDQSGVFINPMLRGASLKLKTVNAVENGVPVVCTSVGNEGTGFQDNVHVLVRDSAETFAAAVSELVNDSTRGQELAASAQQFLSKTYNHEQQISCLLENLFR